MAWAYTVSWEDGVEANYDTISEIVADIINDLAEEECWQRIKFWANLMDTPAWKNKSEEEAIAYLQENGDGIEDITINKVNN